MNDVVERWRQMLAHDPLMVSVLRSDIQAVVDEIDHMAVDVMRLHVQAEQERAAADKAIQLMDEHVREAGKLRGEIAVLRDELRRLKATPEYGEWVSVEDRLPDLGVNVFAAEKYGIVFVDRRIRCSYGGDTVWEHGHKIDTEITHWMLIEYPKPPEMSGDDEHFDCEDSPAYELGDEYFDTLPKEVHRVTAIVTRVDRPGPPPIDYEDSPAYIGHTVVDERIEED